MASLKSAFQVMVIRFKQRRRNAGPAIYWGILESTRLLTQYGYEGLFAASLLESLGLPIPGAVVLLAAGAAAAVGDLNTLLVVTLPIAAMLIGDTLLYVGGRYTGWTLLGFLCRVSLNPETCILRSARRFYERGHTALLIAKFFPGVNTMAPPLAGSMNMRPSQFLRFDLGGVLIYTFAYEGVGFLFHGVLQQILHGLRTFGRAAEWLLAVAFLAYLGYRVWNFVRHRKGSTAPRVNADEVAARLSRDPGSMLIADVRSHGYYDPDAQRIRSSFRLEPNNLDAIVETLPRDKSIYLYCT
jgi:membrane protein DedA with SNARE-associated domain